MRIAPGSRGREEVKILGTVVPEKVDHTGQLVVCRQAKVIIHLMKESVLRGRHRYNLIPPSGLGFTFMWVCLADLHGPVVQCSGAGGW